LHQLFVNIDNINSKGFITIQFFKNGRWQEIIIDTLIPYSTESKNPIYGHCLNRAECWVPLLEKAYAKLHGN